jgi:hypothetical protein
MRRWQVLGCVLGAALAPGCWDKGCTDLGCPTPVSVKVAPEGGVWEPGEYDLRIVRDDWTSSCGFTLPSEGSTRPITCGSWIRGELVQMTDCSSASEAGDGGRCQQLAGQYYLRLEVTAATEHLRIELSHDSKMVLSDERAPDYESSEPNGADCGTCRAASYELTVEPSP